MYKLGGRRKLGKTASHRRALIQNQVRSLLINGKVQTTTPKAKVLKANAESFLSKGVKKEDRAKEMLLSMSLKNEDVSRVLEYLKKDPKVTLVKVGYRSGDNAELSKVKLIGYSKEEKKKSTKPKKEAKKEGSKEDKSKEEGQDKDQNIRQDKQDQKEVKKSIRSRLSRKKTRARSRSGI